MGVVQRAGLSIGDVGGGVLRTQMDTDAHGWNLRGVLEGRTAGGTPTPLGLAAEVELDPPGRSGKILRQASRLPHRAARPTEPPWPIELPWPIGPRGRGGEAVSKVGVGGD